MRGGERARTGFEFKKRLALILAAAKGIQTACTVILLAADVNAILVVEAVANGLLMGVSYYKATD